MRTPSIRAWPPYVYLAIRRVYRLAMAEPHETIGAAGGMESAARAARDVRRLRAVPMVIGSHPRTRPALLVPVVRAVRCSTQTGDSSPARNASGTRLSLQASLEPLDLSRGVDDVLLPGDERVAVAAHVDAQLLSGRAHRELCPARAAVNACLVVLGVNIGFHGAPWTPSVPVHAGRWSPLLLRRRLGRRLRRFRAHDAHALLVLRRVVEPNVAVDRREDRVVVTETGPVACLEGHAALANDDRAGSDELTVAGLDAEPLADAIAAVFRARSRLLVCHRYSSFSSAAGGTPGSGVSSPLVGAWASGTVVAVVSSLSVVTVSTGGTWVSASPAASVVTGVTALSGSAASAGPVASAEVSASTGVAVGWARARVRFGVSATGPIASARPSG